MRVTAQVKTRTRRRILDAAGKLFVKQGFEQTTTRELARKAGVAEGTLFNYFPSKEAIAGAIVAEAFTLAGDDFDDRRRPEATLEELLFALVAATLRRLDPCRRFLGAVLTSALSPLAAARPAEPADALRTEHLERVDQLLTEHGRGDAMQPVAAHLYWTLLTGVLAFWIHDDSPNQEDTLALLDQSLNLFVRSLSRQPDTPIEPARDETQTPSNDSPLTKEGVP